MEQAKGDDGLVPEVVSSGLATYLLPYLQLCVETATRAYRKQRSLPGGTR